MAPPAQASKANPAPVSPPARLHLRNILPLSPEEPPIMPPPPRTPRAWVWQCHMCLSIYRLGCTRRCLDCSHTYCVSNPNSSSSSLRPGTPRGKKRRRNTGLCGAEFDYVGWEQWGSWRRKVLGHEAAGRCEAEARDRAFLKKRHDCWIDCDSPSECCHRRYELAVEVLKQQSLVTSANRPPVNPDDDDDLAITEVRSEGAGGEEAPPKSPLGQSSFLWDEEEEEKGARGGEDEEGEEDEDGVTWWAARSDPAAGDDGVGLGIDGGESRDWGDFVDDYDYYGDSQSRKSRDEPVKRLTVRNLTGGDADAEDSDSDSGYSDGWSTNSSESDDSSIETGAGRGSKVS
ncbi:hypothetical protein ANO14919_045580 [Xylariales sp. No.14919]|nr:hypothetical protein ANO14919_045580 [Xylariales sp. No.14919]